MGDPAPPETRMVGNIFYAPKSDKVYPLPLHNYTSTVPFAYVNPSAGDYRLSVPTWTDTSDGRISGITRPTATVPQRSNIYNPLH